MMTNQQIQSRKQRYFGIPPKFDPEKGKTVFQPEGEGYGYWVGGHNVIFDLVSLLPPRMHFESRYVF